MAVISLLSDFGVADAYVGTMKGVILSIDSAAILVDLTHAVPPHDIAAGAFLLAQAVDYFPRGAIHLAVVDPGVGGARRAIAVESEVGQFVAPDNGLLSLALAGRRVRAVEIREPRFLLPSRSATFHGRDVFAPAAAHLSRGLALDELGPPARRLTRLRWPAPRRRGASVHGAVVHVDHFGNLITNLAREQLSARFELRAGAFHTRRLARSYDAAARGELLALVGSAGLIEIAAREASAAALLGLQRGARVELRLL